MKRLKIASDIRVSARRVIEGGWIARVPEIVELDEEYVRAYTRYFMAQGLRPLDANAECVQRAQAVLTGGWAQKLRQAERRWAKEYLARFGDLEGFDPAYMASAFVPEQNLGRAGNPHISQMFVEMRDGV